MERGSVFPSANPPRGSVFVVAPHTLSYELAAKGRQRHSWGRGGYLGDDSAIRLRACQGRVGGFLWESFSVRCTPGRGPPVEHAAARRTRCTAAQGGAPRRPRCVLRSSGAQAQSNVDRCVRCVLLLSVCPVKLCLASVANTALGEQGLLPRAFDLIISNSLPLLHVCPLPSLLTRCCAGKPMAVQQHADIIAVSYEARALGVKKHMPVSSIRREHPTVKLVHVEVRRTSM